MAPTRLAALSLTALLLVSLSLLAYPMVVIQPFRHQGPAELQAALWIVRWRIWFEAAAVVGTLLTLAWYWRNQPRAIPRGFAILATVLTCGAAALTRVNVFELMFHRYDQPAFVKASEALVDADDKVLAIALHGQARAYPIRTIGYHHIINDEIGGIPVVTTY